MIDIHVLFLDDNKNRHKTFIHNNLELIRTHVYTADDCIRELANNIGSKTPFDVIFLDHDLDMTTNNELNDNEKDGRYVATKMTEKSFCEAYKDTIVVIHSLNSRGATIMQKTLQDAGYRHVLKKPFVWESNVRQQLSYWI